MNEYEEKCVQTICTYRGKVIEMMTREELIAAVKWLGRAYANKLQENLDRFPRYVRPSYE